MFVATEGVSLATLYLYSWFEKIISKSMQAKRLMCGWTTPLEAQKAFFIAITNYKKDVPEVSSGSTE